MNPSPVNSAAKPDIVVDMSDHDMYGNPSRERLSSLDIFRGVTIAAMILVNDPGDWSSIYSPLRHSEWNGWTPTDLVFPFFLFIVGVSLVFSFSARRNRGKSRGALMAHILRRGVILFALGVFINGFPNHFNPATLRIEGVLQRIALCYVIASMLYLFCGPKARWAAVFTCLAGYWVLLRDVPVPGLGMPTHGFPFLDHNRNLTAWLDRKLLMGHLYNHTNDPEGALSTIPAVASTLLGIFTGEWLRSNRTYSQKILRMVFYGIACFAIGEIWSIWFPINKNLWTSSFVLLTGGLAMIGLAFCYWIFDARKIRMRLADFFLIFGVNAIAAYVLSELLAALITTISFHSSHGMTTLQGWIYHTLFAPFARPINASLIYAGAYVLVCWIPMWILYRKRILLKI
jgi:predicted acyltransferase